MKKPNKRILGINLIWWSKVVKIRKSEWIWNDEHFEEIKKSLHPHTQIKASGGVRTLDQALDMIKNGATRLGSSNGVKIIEGLEVTGGY